MVSMSERMARGPARIQLKYKDQKELARIHSPFCASIRHWECRTRMARLPGPLRPSLHDLRDQFSENDRSGIARCG